MTASPQTQASLSYELLLRKSLDERPAILCAGEGDGAASSTAEPESSAASSTGPTGHGSSCSDCGSTEEACPKGESAAVAPTMPSRASVQLLRNVSVQDKDIAELLQQTRKLSEVVFEENCLQEITKKSGWKLSLLVSDDLTVLCGFVVSKVMNGSLSIAKIAVPASFRGLRFGKLIMDELMKGAKKQGDVYEVCLSSLPTAVTFYQRLGFKAFKGLKVKSDEDLVEGQVYMEKRLRQRPRRS